MSGLKIPPPPPAADVSAGLLVLPKIGVFFADAARLPKEGNELLSNIVVVAKLVPVVVVGVLVLVVVVVVVVVTLGVMLAFEAKSNLGGVEVVGVVPNEKGLDDGTDPVVVLVGCGGRPKLNDGPVVD